jgi:hypothetical protein
MLMGIQNHSGLQPYKLQQQRTLRVNSAAVANEILRLQCLQKLFKHLDFLHILMCYKVGLKWIELSFLVNDRHKIL